MRRTAMLILFCLALFPSSLQAAENEAKKIVFVAGNRSHGYGSHEHYAGCKLLATRLQQAMPNYQCVVYQNGWPKEKDAFDGASAIVMYADGGGRHPANPHLEQVNALMEKGVGVVCIHYGVETTKGKNGEAFIDWIGGYFEPYWSVNPHWTAEFKKLPDHPITRGVKPFQINDEWYYHMRFRDGMKGVTPILTAMPGPDTLRRKDGAHSGNPHVRAAVLDRKEEQHVAWCSENPNGSRGFGFTGGHFHWNWGNPNFRKVVLNAIVWTSHGDVPAKGVSDKEVTLEDLEANQDYDQPGNFNRDSIKQRLNLKSSGKKAGKMRKGPKPTWASKVVTTRTPGHAVPVSVDIRGAQNLYLVVNDGGNGYGCDWAAWANPKLTGNGEKDLTLLKWKSASSNFGSVQVNRNCNGQPIRINGKPYAKGLGTHANSVIHYQLPKNHKFTKFEAIAGLDNGGTDQGACGNASSVGFAVYTQKPVIRSSVAGGNSADRDAASALGGLDVAEGLDASLFAAEPNILSLSNFDIDHMGRVWACEIVNYRRHNGKRSEGDRMVICDDANLDGMAERFTTFYQGNEIDSVHGICVLPTASGKGTRAIVSAKDKVWIFTDTNGDLKADEKKVLFSGISGTQHDHGIHAFVFGPDGKLYFNFGNVGKQIKDANGKPIIDKAGNEVNDRRKPYQEGMVFRCNLDGSEFETLGWNFRNNWEVNIDSYGTLWQSDNDDDGNRGVRINFVMEFGNYGYKDELTGAGWKTKRTNMEKTIPEQHWHLNDPGVVPNLIQTGAGSPTGICVYEGNLLPTRFHNQVIHCDAGPNIVRAYPVQDSGAGYSAKIDNILAGARDKWFRPSDVCVAPDGSLFVADWYDPGVGGHGMGDLDRGRIFRLAPEGSRYTVPKYDFSTARGCVEALKSPNMAARHVAFTELKKMGDQATSALQAMARDTNPRFQARAIWLMGKMAKDANSVVQTAIGSKDSNLRIVGLRLARQLDNVDTLSIVGKLVRDPSPQVRRECAVALSEQEGQKAVGLWAALANQHDGKDRWYLEALGIGARGKWNACLKEFMSQSKKPITDPVVKDIVWRSRGSATPDKLADILLSGQVKEQEAPRFMRAFDFFKNSPEAEKALERLLELE
ncbi:MAG: PVC-type heme-binding CxxCH protein [Planctomycetota bacterium]|nr:PVC-type heme-binding CxxCH protein [Planctomycetota bacterium]